ncbi:MAG TPA: amino acid adenylation domain-containing protein, partial [Vicinamibacteria bacterium]
HLFELALLTAAERHQLLAEWNDTGAEELGELLHELFERRVELDPKAVAVVSGERSLSYGELDRRARRIARALRRLGGGPEVPVGLCLERTENLLAGVLGILVAGGTYVPLDPAYPPERNAFVLRDSGAAAVLTSAGVRERLPAALPPVVDLDEALAAEADELPAVSALPGHLAYLIYTSGSTGVPKAVALEHRSAVAFVRWAGTVFSPDELRGVLFSTSVCFDLSVFEMFVPLAWGGRVIVADNALHLSTLGAAGEVTLVNTVPSALAALLAAGGLPGSVRTVSLAGEPLRPALAGEILRSGVPRLLNLYGPSEDTTYSTWAAVSEGEVPAIGRPLTGTQAHVLDAAFDPVPLGVAGELCLGGVGLARGYLGRPELTAGRFVPDPFGAAGARLYRTGDLARRRPDGSLEFLGRLDHQVKVRGFRIEPGEIESALLAHPEVREALVAALAEADGTTRLAAYVAGDAAVDVSELRRHLRARLPEHMVPSLWVVLPELPRLPNGKVDRRALPAPAGLSDEGADRSAARTPLEEIVAGIFAEVLAIDPPSGGASFFDLGGHSLLATRVVSRLRSALGIELPLRALFEEPTAAGLARRVEEALAAGAGLEAPPLRRVAREGRLPLSFAQQRLWFLWQLEPGSAAYNIPQALRIQGPLEAVALERALDEIVQRHEVLRTIFPAMPAMDGDPVQQITPARLTLPLVDLTGLPAEPRESLARREAGLEASAPFDLAREIPVRARLLRLAAEDHVLLLTFHHIASDAWSGTVLQREVSALYSAFAAGLPSPLPELAIQYADFAQWQRQWLQGEALERQLAYWREQLRGVPPVLDLPLDRPRPSVSSSRGRTIPFRLSAPLSRSLMALGGRHAATLFMTLQAGLQALLARYSGQTDVCLGTPIAGRRHLETEGLIGFFVNTLVLRGRVEGDPTFEDLLEQARETALGAYTHQ